MNIIKDLFKNWDIVDTIISVLCLICAVYIMLTYSEHFDPMF